MLSGTKRVAFDRSRVVEFGLFLGSVLALQALRFLYSLVVASGITPADFAEWALFVTLVGYWPTTTLGVANGMNRLIPILMGRRQDAEADATERAAWRVVAALAVSGLALAGLLGSLGTSWWVTLGVLAGSAMTVYQVQQFAMRSRLRFNRASAQQWTWAVITGSGLLILLVSDGSLSTALWIWTLGSGGAIAVGYALHRPPLARVRSAQTVEIMRMGFPIMLSGLLGTLFFTADRWVASAGFERSAAGIYGLASLFASAVFLVPMVIAQQQYPRLAMLYGSDGLGPNLRAAVRRQSLVAIAASLVVALIVATVALGIVPLVLPAYGGVGPAAVVLSLGIVALAGATGYANLLVVVGARWTYLATQAPCFLLALLLMRVGAQLGGSVGLAIGAAIGQLILMIAVISVARGQARRKTAR